MLHPRRSALNYGTIDADTPRVQGGIVSEADPQTRDTIRMPEHAIRALLDSLDRDQQSSNRLDGAAGDDPRRGPRPLSCTPIVLELTRPGEGTVRFLVAPRHLQANRMTVVHGVFLHPDARCVVHLRTIDGEKIAVMGRLAQCVYAGARMHESTIIFDQPIELEHYLATVPAEGQVLPSRPAARDASTTEVTPAKSSEKAAVEEQVVLALAQGLVETIRAHGPRESVLKLLDDLRAAYAAGPGKPHGPPSSGAPARAA